MPFNSSRQAVLSFGCISDMLWRRISGDFTQLVRIGHLKVSRVLFWRHYMKPWVTESRTSSHIPQIRLTLLMTLTLQLSSNWKFLRTSFTALWATYSAVHNDFLSKKEADAFPVAVARIKKTTSSVLCETLPFVLNHGWQSLTWLVISVLTSKFKHYLKWNAINLELEL